MRFRWILLVSVLTVACHPGPVINAGAKQPSVGGTIAGIVSTADASVAVPGRKVTAIETTNGSRYDTTTATNGGYTIRVPEGTYRIEIELRAGEALAKQPDTTRINNSDLDSGRDFVITAKLAR
jgi:Carboxypeptidase regulatory-like domain